MAVFKTGRDDATRLTAIQEYTDSFTRDVLQSLALPASADCLEVGAGGGTIARWLADEFPEGATEAVDIDISLLADSLPANLKVVKADIESLERSPESFDLIHARFVLSHLPGRDLLLGRLASWLRPGGWLVVTDPYQLDPAKAPHPLVRKVFAAYVSCLNSRGMDLEWIRAVPTLLSRAGLGSVSCSSRTTHLGGGESDRWAPLIMPVADQLLAKGVSQEALDGFFEALRDPQVIDFPQIIISAVGQKPQ